MLDQEHADRWQLGDLVATEPSSRPMLLLAEPAAAATTRIRIVIDDLIHLIGRLQPATGTAMAGLPTRLALLTLPAHQLLRLRARFRAPLSPRFRWILRRRLRTRARVLTRLGLQSRQPLPVLFNLSS